MTTPGEHHAPSFVAICWRRPGAGGVGSGRSAYDATRFARRQARPRVRHGVQRRRPRSAEEVPHQLHGPRPVREPGRARPPVRAQQRQAATPQRPEGDGPGDHPAGPHRPDGGGRGDQRPIREGGPAPADAHRTSTGQSSRREADQTDHGRGDCPGPRRARAQARRRGPLFRSGAAGQGRRPALSKGGRPGEPLVPGAEQYRHEVQFGFDEQDAHRGGRRPTGPAGQAVL